MKKEAVPGCPKRSPGKTEIGSRALAVAPLPSQFNSLVWTLPLESRKNNVKSEKVKMQSCIRLLVEESCL